MPEEGKHASLLQLLQDRKSSTKGRASRPMAICLDTELSMDLEDAEQELADAKAAVAEAESHADSRAGGKVAIDPELTKAVTAAEKKVAQAEAAVDAASVIVTFTALKAEDYDKLKDEHPPREGNEYDAISEYNRETFPDALMEASASKKVRDADGNLVDMDVAELIATMSNGERTIACQVSNDVNLRTSSFSDAKSLSRRRSGSNSKRR
ncbi:MAG TPA: hypothetical protein VGL05_19475 [Kribbella sp.]